MWWKCRLLLLLNSPDLPSPSHAGCWFIFKELPKQLTSLSLVLLHLHHGSSWCVGLHPDAPNCAQWCWTSSVSHHRAKLCQCSLCKHNQKPARIILFHIIEDKASNLFCLELLHCPPNRAQVDFLWDTHSGGTTPWLWIENLTGAETNNLGQCLLTFCSRAAFVKDYKRKDQFKSTVIYALVNSAGNIITFWADVRFNYDSGVYSFQHTSGPWPLHLCWVLKWDLLMPCIHTASTLQAHSLMFQGFWKKISLKWKSSLWASGCSFQVQLQPVSIWGSLAKLPVMLF